MKSLTAQQRKYLRSQAHHLEPIVLIGKHGLTDGSIEAINKALDAHELVKIKFREHKDEKQFLSIQLAESTESHIVGIVGHTVILYRQNSDPDEQIIHLPDLK